MSIHLCNRWSKDNWQEPNSRWLPWRPNWMSGGHLWWSVKLIIEKKLPPIAPNKPQKNLINWPRHLFYNWRKSNVYGHRRHRRIAHDIMPPPTDGRGHKNSIACVGMEGSLKRGIKCCTERSATSSDVIVEKPNWSISDLIPVTWSIIGLERIDL
jgi:hypothetical protein